MVKAGKHACGGASLFPDANAGSGLIHRPISANANMNAIEQTRTYKF